MKHFFPLKYLFFFFSIVVANYDGLLQVANLFILGNEKCNQYLKGKITVNESEICAVAETIGAGPCEVNIAVPNTFLAISFLKKENYWRFFFYNYSHCTKPLHWKIIWATITWVQVCYFMSEWRNYFNFTVLPRHWKIYRNLTHTHILNHFTILRQTCVLYSKNKGGLCGSNCCVLWLSRNHRLEQIYLLI